jgi:hypothetical protein
LLVIGFEFEAAAFFGFGEEVVEGAEAVGALIKTGIAEARRSTCAF